MQVFQNLSNSYKGLWKNIIQPQRQQYSYENLGPQERYIKEELIYCNNFQVPNQKNENLECSHYYPQNPKQNSPIVIYLHGNSGSRIESMSTLRYLLPEIQLFSFDFSGSGKSEGKYVTMGLNEHRDLESIVNFVKQNITTGPIILWGRSMGAVTSIIYSAKMQKNINLLVFDSPFSDLYAVMGEIAFTKTNVPRFVIDIAISVVKGNIKDELQEDIFQFDLLQDAAKIKIPAIFAYAKGDTIIQPYHSQNLYEKFSGEKQIFSFDGNHNTIRPHTFFQQIMEFLEERLIKIQQQQQFQSINSLFQKPQQIQKSYKNSVLFNQNLSNNDTPINQLKFQKPQDQKYANQIQQRSFIFPQKNQSTQNIAQSQNNTTCKKERNKNQDSNSPIYRFGQKNYINQEKYLQNSASDNNKINNNIYSQGKNNQQNNQNQNIQGKKLLFQDDYQGQNQQDKIENPLYLDNTDQMINDLTKSLNDFHLKQQQQQQQQQQEQYQQYSPKFNNQQNQQIQENQKEDFSKLFDNNITNNNNNSKINQQQKYQISNKYMQNMSSMQKKEVSLTDTYEDESIYMQRQRQQHLQENSSNNNIPVTKNRPQSQNIKQNYMQIYLEQQNKYKEQLQNNDNQIQNQNTFEFNNNQIQPVGSKNINILNMKSQEFVRNENNLSKKDNSPLKTGQNTNKPTKNPIFSNQNKEQNQIQPYFKQSQQNKYVNAYFQNQQNQANSVSPNYRGKKAIEKQENSKLFQDLQQKLFNEKKLQYSPKNIINYKQKSQTPQEKMYQKYPKNQQNNQYIKKKYDFHETPQPSSQGLDFENKHLYQTYTQLPSHIENHHHKVHSQIPTEFPDEKGHVQSQRQTNYSTNEERNTSNNNNNNSQIPISFQVYQNNHQNYQKQYELQKQQKQYQQQQQQTGQSQIHNTLFTDIDQDQNQNQNQFQKQNNIQQSSYSPQPQKKGLTIMQSQNYQQNLQQNQQQYQQQNNFKKQQSFQYQQQQNQQHKQNFNSNQNSQRLQDNPQNYQNYQTSQPGFSNNFQNPVDLKNNIKKASYDSRNESLQQSQNTDNSSRPQQYNQQSQALYSQKITPVSSHIQQKQNIQQNMNDSSINNRQISQSLNNYNQILNQNTNKSNNNQNNQQNAFQQFSQNSQISQKQIGYDQQNNQQMASSNQLKQSQNVIQQSNVTSFVQQSQENGLNSLIRNRNQNNTNKTQNQQQNYSFQPLSIEKPNNSYNNNNTNQVNKTYQNQNQLYQQQQQGYKLGEFQQQSQQQYQFQKYN